jgi:betaine-aldehyde dehydrogenase
MDDQPGKSLLGGLDRELFYDGAFHSPKGGYADTFAPATGENLGRAACANRADVDMCVSAAHEAFPAWRDRAPADRARCLKALAIKIREAASDLAWLDALNCGNPISELMKDTMISAAVCDYYAGLVLEAKGSVLPTQEGILNYSLRQPFGVVARVVAYNHPLLFLAAKLGPAVAVGNTVILKAPDQAPLSAYRLAQLVAETFPKGVVSVLTGGAECGKALIEHPLVRRASLVGSTRTGAAILKSAADKIMPVSLELGGKNPLIICADADLDKAIEGTVEGMNMSWAGQSCGSTSRCLVHRSHYETVIRKLRRIMSERYICGLPTDPETTMGSLISKAQLDKVMDLIESAKAEGAILVCGGKRPDNPQLADGCFVEPTVFADVTRQMRLFNEEVFGPVLAVTPFDTEEEALELANSVDYGLTASIWTQNLATAHRLAEKVEAGFVWINRSAAHFLGADFGGWKKSGIGREEGLDELLSFTQNKNVHVSYN